MILLISILASCIGNTSRILNDTICQAPCWRGITMGGSQEEAIKIVTHMPDVDLSSITIDKKNDRPMMEQGINWKFKNPSGLASVYFHNDKVTMISFPNDDELRLSDLINKYGDPDYVYLHKDVFEVVYMTVYIFFAKKGICLGYEPASFPFYNPKNIQIKPSAILKGIAYADLSIPNWQVKLCLPGLEEDKYEKDVQKWVGYGTYSFPQSAPNS